MRMADRENISHLLNGGKCVDPEDLRDRRGLGSVLREFGGLLFFAVLALLAGELWYTRRLVARGV